MRLDFVFGKGEQTINFLVLQNVSSHAYGRGIQAHMSTLSVKP